MPDKGGETADGARLQEIGNMELRPKEKEAGEAGERQPNCKYYVGLSVGMAGDTGDSCGNYWQ